LLSPTQICCDIGVVEGVTTGGEALVSYGDDTVTLDRALFTTVGFITHTIIDLLRVVLT